MVLRGQLQIPRQSIKTQDDGIDRSILLSQINPFLKK